MQFECSVLAHCDVSAIHHKIAFPLFHTHTDIAVVVAVSDVAAVVAAVVGVSDTAGIVH